MTLLEAADAPAADVGGRGRAWAAVGVVCAALFLLGLDFTVLNVAIPALRRELRPTLAETQWIVDGYALALGGCVLAAGALGDRYGRRRAFVAGLSVCAAASALGATGHSPAELIAARCGMGLGAALFMPATLATIVRLVTDPADRRRAIAVWAAVAGVGALAGPVVGGWLVERHGWRAAFWLNLPVALAVVGAALVLVPESRAARPRPLDGVGAALSSGGLLALVWGIIEAPGRGWTGGPVLAAFAVAAVLGTGFAGWESRCAAPMVPVAVVRRRPAGPASVSLSLMSFAMFGAMFLLTLYLQQVRGLSAWAAGLRMVPLSLGLAAGAAASPAASARLGARTPVTAGLGLITLGLLVLTQLTVGSGEGPVLLFEAVGGLGAGLVAPAATEVVMDAVPSGVGSALNDATRQVGSTLGVAVLGSVLATGSADLLAAGHDPGAAFVAGLGDAAALGATVTALGAVLAWRLLPARS